ncbi:MAG: hypothetical protein AAGA62_11310 [Bacteroidota bacterium]
MKQLTILLCFLSLLGTCGSALHAQKAPKMKLTPHTFVAADGRETATERGEFQVPQDRNDPDGRQLTLRF